MQSYSNIHSYQFKDKSTVLSALDVLSWPIRTTFGGRSVNIFKDTPKGHNLLTRIATVVAVAIGVYFIPAITACVVGVSLLSYGIKIVIIKRMQQYQFPELKSLNDLKAEKGVLKKITKSEREIVEDLCNLDQENDLVKFSAIVEKIAQNNNPIITKRVQQLSELVDRIFPYQKLKGLTEFQPVKINQKKLSSSEKEMIDELSLIREDDDDVLEKLDAVRNKIATSNDPRMVELALSVDHMIFASCSAVLQQIDVGINSLPVENDEQLIFKIKMSKGLIGFCKKLQSFDFKNPKRIDLTYPIGALNYLREHDQTIYTGTCLINTDVEETTDPRKRGKTIGSVTSTVVVHKDEQESTDPRQPLKRTTSTLRRTKIANTTMGRKKGKDQKQRPSVIGLFPNSEKN